MVRRLAWTLLAVGLAGFPALGAASQEAAESERRVVIEITDPDYVDPAELAETTWRSIGESTDGYDAEAHAQWGASHARFAYDRGDYRAALGILLETRKALRRRAPGDFRSEALVQRELAEVYTQLDQAERSYRARFASVEALEKGLGPDHAEAGLARLQLVGAMHLRSTPVRARGFLSQSLRQTRDVIRRAEGARGPHDPVAGLGKVVLATLRMISQPQNPKRAEKLLRPVIDDEEQAPQIRALAAATLARLYDHAGATKKAEAVRAQIPAAPERPDEPMIVHEDRDAKRAVTTVGGLRSMPSVTLPGLGFGNYSDVAAEGNIAVEPLEPTLAGSWVDAVYCVEPSGEVTSVEITDGDSPSWWRASVVQLVQSRRFQPWTPKPGEACLARRERIAVHTEYRKTVGTLIPQPLTALRVTRRVLEVPELPRSSPGVDPVR